jgi:hypothetical protein
VYSHQTALSIHELSDVNPSKLHMTVPSKFRRSAQIPKSLVLHRAMLDKKDVEHRQGFAVTRPLRAIAEAVRCRPSICALHHIRAGTSVRQSRTRETKFELEWAKASGALDLVPAALAISRSGSRAVRAGGSATCIWRAELCQAAARMEAITR